MTRVVRSKASASLLPANAMRVTVRGAREFASVRFSGRTPPSRELALGAGRAARAWASASALRGRALRGVLWPRSLRPIICATTTRPCPPGCIFDKGWWPGTCASTRQVPDCRPFGLRIHIAQPSTQSLRPIICTTSTHPCPSDLVFLSGMMAGYLGAC